MKTKLFVVLVFLSVVSAVFAVDIDGIVAEAEYGKEASVDNGNFRLYWTIQDNVVSMALKVKANGWVAIGFEPTRVMADADMVFGMVPASGKVEAIDAYSTGTFGPHPPDGNLGGKYDILAFAGSNKDGWITFEFSRALNTGDKYDKTLSTGPLKVIWAYGRDFSFTSKHAKAGTVTIQF